MCFETKRFKTEEEVCNFIKTLRDLMSKYADYFYYDRKNKDNFMFGFEDQYGVSILIEVGYFTNEDDYSCFFNTVLMGDKEAIEEFLEEMCKNHGN